MLWKWQTIYKKYFSSHALIISNSITLIGSLASTILCLQIFSLESFGEISYVIKSANILAFLSNFGMSYALNQYPWYISKRFKPFIIIYFIIALINLIISSVYFKSYSNGSYFLAGILLAQSLGFLLLYFGFLNGNLETKLYAIVRIAQNVVPVTFLIFYFMSNAQLSSIKYLWIIILVYYSLITIALLKSVRNLRSQTRAYNQSSIDTFEFTNFAKNSYFIQLYRSLHLNLDFMILGFIVTSTSLAEYSIALTLAMTPQLYIASKQISAQTDARDSTSIMLSIANARDMITKNIYISTGFLALEILFLFLFHNFIFKEDITNVLVLTLILAPASLVDSSGALFGNLLIGFNQNKIYSKIQFQGFILNLLLIIIGVRFFGAYGAAIASLVSYSFILLSTVRVLGGK
jgi:O-antigen/teichoic acid export membrane protein